LRDVATVLELQALVARFANSFDLKDWKGLGECLAESLHVDYQDLRGTPPETMSREEFVRLREVALQELDTHHLAGNLEVHASEDQAELRVSMMINRRSRGGDTLATHCLYFLGAEQHDGVWRIHSIRQKVLINDGNIAIHKGIVKR
jgi:hypothetical protein